MNARGRNTTLRIHFCDLLRVDNSYSKQAGLLHVASSCNDDNATASFITAENTFSGKIYGNRLVPENHGD